MSSVNQKHQKSIQSHSNYPPFSQQNSSKIGEHSTIKFLKEYRQKIICSEQQNKVKIQVLKESVRKKFMEQLQLELNIFIKEFERQKQDLSGDLKTLEYYVQNFMEKHCLNPKENNLYPLFNQIDRKINLNNSFLDEKFIFEFRYPISKTQLSRNLSVLKAEIMQKQLQSIRSFLAHNQNIRKYCNTQLKLIKNIHDSYGNIYALAEKNLCTPQLQFTGDFQQVLLAIEISKNIERLNISIRSPDGKISLSSYKTLTNKILASKRLLTHVNIKIMDMQFEEQKCRLIKSFVKELRVLRSFKIQNYYKENKLGFFEDFNWYPLKKQTHVVGKVW